MKSAPLNFSRSSATRLRHRSFLAPRPSFRSPPCFVQVPAALDNQDYREILALRRECYSEAGKVSAHTTTLDMASDSDASASVMGFWWGNKLVGTMRVRAPSERDVLETIDGALGFYPPTFPAKKKVIEVSALCIKRDFRRSGLFKIFCEEVHAQLVRLGRSHILISADDRLRAKYRFIGFSCTGYGYEKPESRFPHLNIMISHQKPLGIYGLHADPIRWNIFLRETTDRLLAEGVLHHSPAEKILFGRFGIFRWFRPLANVWEKYCFKKR